MRARIRSMRFAIDVISRVRTCATMSPQRNIELMATLRKEVMDMVDIFGTIKMYIQLNIPKIEDGNNFGSCLQ